MHEGRPFLVLELLRGQTLAELLATHPEPAALPPEEAVRWMLLILEAVARLHEAGLVHRDLKPENLFLREQGSVALVDLGLTREVGTAAEPSSSEPETLPEERPGTLLYMAPELSAGPVPAEPSADVYALGVVFFELLTGRPPFIGDVAEVLRGHASLRAPRLGSLRPEAAAWEPFVARCLAKEPAHRYLHAAEALEALRRLAVPGLSAVPEPAPGSSAPVSRPRERLVALLAVQAGAPLPEVSAALAAEGGVLARVHRELYVAAFPEALSPAAGLKAAAHAALRWGRGPRLIHLAELQVHMGRAGTRLSGAALEQAPLWWARLPPGEHPWISAEAAPWMEPGEWLDGEAGFHRLREVDGARGGAGEAPPAPLVGREPLLAALEARAQASLGRRQPALVVLESGPGLGRSRLLEALAQRLVSRPPVQVVRLGARPADSETLETLPRALLALAPEPVAEEELSRALSLPPDARRQTLARLAARALRQRAAQGPVALLLDDAGHMDTATLDAVVQATSAEEVVPLWICLASAPGLLALRPALAERAGPEGVWELPPLTAEDSQQLLRALLWPVEYVPQALLEQLAALAGDVPRHLEELVRALQATGAVRRTPGGAWELALEAVPLGSAGRVLAPLAAQALAALPSPLQTLARLGAVLGEALSVERLALALAALEQEPELEALAALDAGAGLRRLERAGLLHVEASGRAAFLQPLLREALEAATPPQLRERLHRAALATTREGETANALLRQRARHAAAVGEGALACECWVLLAEKAWRAFRDVEAELACTAALEWVASGDGPLRLRALATRGRVRLRSHRYREACQDVARAAALALELGAHAEAALLLLEQATALDWLEDWEGAQALVERAAEAGRGWEERPPLAPRLALARGRTEARRGSWEPALLLLEQAAREAERSGDTEVLTVALTMWPVGLAYLGRLEEAEALFLRALEHCQARGDMLHLAVVHMNRFALWLSRLDLSRAVEDLQQAQALAHRLAHAQVERFSGFNLAVLLLMVGRVQEAEAAAQRALELGQRYFPESSLGPDRLLLARLCLERAETQEALRHVRWVETHAAPPAESTPALLLALVRQVLAQGEGAAYAHGEWEALLAQARQRCAPFELVDVLLEACGCALRAGAREALQRLLAEASELVTATPALQVRLEAMKARALRT
ncbi:hypothetical protein DB31_4080 [Hyalangium minutum]|uniref:non-specific serine/threonine protein kinase n=1 Tax=Hyalangium minutum TaxID=394096 RepID=A0A085W3V7_9BACT|nr:hypothetical protein DB31_4080 [Hyalangium minutum]